MTKFVPPVQRKNRGRTHWYVDGNGNRMPGVTTLLGNGIPKPALINWAANATAEAAVNQWDQLSELRVADRLTTLQRARYEKPDKAKKRGTEVHNLAERLVKGEAVQAIPDEIRGHVEAYVRFLDRYDVEPVLVEVTIVSYKYGYAGTLDLVAWLNTTDGRQLWLLDIKTNEKGIYGETALQLAGYRYAEFYVGSDGKEHPMPAVERTGAIHVTSDDALLIPTISGEAQLRTLWYAGRVAEFVDNSRDLIGDSIEPFDPAPSTARLVFEETPQEKEA